MIEYKVYSFNTSKAAYYYIRKNPSKYSLLIVDYKILGKNGLFLVTKLLEINPKLNVILLNGL